MSVLHRYKLSMLSKVLDASHSFLATCDGLVSPHSFAHFIDEIKTFIVGSVIINDNSLLQP